MAPSRCKLTSRTQATLDGFFNQPNSSSTRISKKSPAAKSKYQSKSKSAVPTGSDRVLTDVLLAIKPVHLANIASRQKNHEYRKYRLRDAVTRLWLYETGDGGKGRASITHIAVIPASVRHTPGSVPTEPFGIGNTDFNAGLKESKYGYPVLELYELFRPVTLAEMKSQWGMGGAPMGWRYVKTDLWEDRWGDDQERAVKVNWVF
ncbi:uncharacterized protein BDZ99DRAFT_469562 [Mytilinidion resinicola]|uniref:Uncharacterized protein n=1 Tax=Mytilinidion resinicola TaxID=574789 RepID=A0A6A6XYV1_9PEZI|nr:uncharacterized protein BDZ99DRAFT_469562 [Mytilinidion resinicola]KAF2801559.1 hypothetical protein BDZ99DRAFT_469562 [Mytilinidion resinicola]